MIKLNTNQSYLTLGEHFYARADCDKINNPKLILFNRELARDINLQVDCKNDDVFLAQYFSGNKPLLNASYIALAYAGHQFGNFVPQLGDGRATLIGETLSPRGERFDIQLKGSGPTVFSRGGDGKSPVGPVIREYLMSEAMHALGIPTTRALAAIATGEDVYRSSILPGAVFTRVSPSHIRVGSFEYFAARGMKKELKKLFEYTMTRHFPDSPKTPEHFLAAVSEGLAQLTAQWMAVGFIHGVMNTDNTSIAGVTIDYGPCAFMDRYSQSQVYSYIDRSGRYAFGEQPHIIKWNLARLADCLSLLMGESLGYQNYPSLTGVIEGFNQTYHSYWQELLSQKFGYQKMSTEHEKYIRDFFSCLEKHGLDFTLSFTELRNYYLNQKTTYFPKEMEGTLEGLRTLATDLEEATVLMSNVNPALVPRTHIIEKAISLAERGDYEYFIQLNKSYRSPYSSFKNAPEYWPPKDSERVENTFCGT